MADDIGDLEVVMDTQAIEQETPPSDVFMAPSIDRSEILSGRSYSHFSAVPAGLKQDDVGKPAADEAQGEQEEQEVEVVLGVDEAGRGPVLGPMVYALFYLPVELHHSLLAETHHFDDSKVLRPEVRTDLMRKICTPSTDLYRSCGWATRLLSARDISGGMLAPAQYNLNAQAMDATISLIKGVLARGVNVKEIYIDTIGKPEVYQRKLERIWPTIRITVAKKADSLYPVVSAASVCAKVTRDAALDVCYEPYHQRQLADASAAANETVPWGSGYPSDSRTATWLKANMDPLFGWGNECRFSWATAKELLEVKEGVKMDWPVDDGEGSDMRVTDFFTGTGEEKGDVLVDWFGKRVREDMEVF